MRIVDNISGWNVRVIQTVMGFMFVMVRVSVVVSVIGVVCMKGKEKSRK